jgi:aminoglycoside phosphotransferase (APT) family kinase protein
VGLTVGRDIERVGARIGQWFASRHPGSHDVVVEAEAPTAAAAGYSNEIIFVTVRFGLDGAAHTKELVVRLPPEGPALFPEYDLAMQVAVQQVVGARGVPVPLPQILETDPVWLGAPFVAMPRVQGRIPGELPSVDPWIMGLADADQRRLEANFLDVLARVHTTPWQEAELATTVRGAGGSLDDELAFWECLARWTFDDEPPEVLAGPFAWCHEHRPAVDPPASLLWGDVRLGNVIFGDDLAPVAVLDWEMASVGPAEMDLAWYSALGEMGRYFLDVRVPGFATRDELVAHHERALGRELVDFRWFEVFAMVRATMLGLRTERLQAARTGADPRPPERNALVMLLRDAVAAA